MPLSILLCFLLYCLFVLQCHAEIAKACTPRSVKPCYQQHPRLTQFWFIASIIKTKPKPVKVQHSWALRSPRASRADAAHTSTISLSGSWRHLELLSSKWRTEFLLVLLLTYLWRTYKEVKLSMKYKWTVCFLFSFPLVCENSILDPKRGRSFQQGAWAQNVFYLGYLSKWFQNPGLMLRSLLWIFNYFNINFLYYRNCSVLLVTL